MGRVVPLPWGEVKLLFAESCYSLYREDGFRLEIIEDIADEVVVLFGGGLDVVPDDLSE